VLLDYTPGGPDVNPAAATDIGAADELHGESGDDTLYGQLGRDVLFGDANDDDLIGGTGHDWISGGTGQDGILGDDGRITTSRNGTAEPLHGVAAVTALDELIATPGNQQQAVIHFTGQLKKSANLTPFGISTTNQYAEPTLTEGDDVLYGGLGSDWLHGGLGDDAMSGAEALAAFWNAPVNPGNVLAYDATTTKFAAYDADDPWRKVGGFLLNFDPTEGPIDTRWPAENKNTDGDDVLFGDLNHDWLVGGTGRDHLYGGYGDDLLNVDDDHDTTAASGDPLANNQEDPFQAYADIGYGGAGRDVLIANTGVDRLIDWTGEFNSYIVPFNPFGAPTISRQPSPNMAEWLYKLGFSDGADPTRAADSGTSAARNGEPWGEMGLARQGDPHWGDQHGGPRDPQPGHAPGQRQIRYIDFAGGAPSVASAFATESGTWTLNAATQSYDGDVPSSGGVTLFMADPLSYNYVRYSATLNLNSTGTEAHLVFDYQGPTDYKYAAIQEQGDHIQLGQRTAAGWTVFIESHEPPIHKNQDYQVSVVLMDDTAKLTITNVGSITWDYNTDIMDGDLGLGVRSGRANFDNVLAETSKDGDFNYDEVVNNLDYPFFAASLVARKDTDGRNTDLNRDGRIDIDDFNLLLPLILGGTSLAAEGGPAAGIGETARLSDAELRPVLEAVLARWGAVLGDPALAARLAGITVQIADLGEGRLGQTVGTTVVIDADAAGFGWFVDASPEGDAEFGARVGDALAAAAGSAAVGRMDLLTVLAHEVAHALGFDHGGVVEVLDETLTAGVRITPEILAEIAGRPEYPNLVVVVGTYTENDAGERIDGSGVVIDPAPAIEPGFRGEDVRISRSARVAETAHIAHAVRVEARAQIGEGSYVGEGSLIGKGAFVGRDVYIGAGAVVEAGAVIPDGSVVPAGSTVQGSKKLKQRAERDVDLRTRLRALFDVREQLDTKALLKKRLH
jgi:carbonic anhydrase/acetyltransferase-like protein (isoleucine patch superfamily)